jgi:endonuclease/exonuclease/phosphatase family metal-dependent hydrolase
LPRPAPEADGGPRPRPRRPSVPWFVLRLALLAVLAAGAAALVDDFFGALVRQAREQQRSLRVMTWNIGKLYIGWDSRAADEDLPHIAQVIREADPHVVALQEVRDRAQLGRLLRALGEPWTGDLAEDQYDRRAALVTRLPARPVELPTSTGRTAQGAFVVSPEGSTPFLASVHLDAFDPRRRLTQAEEILSDIDRLEAKDVFLLGDLNLDPSVAARGSVDQHIYQLLTLRLADAARNLGSTTLVSRRLDYVLFRSDRVRRHHAKILRGRRLGLMDHDPLLVEFYMK